MKFTAQESFHVAQEEFKIIQVNNLAGAIHLYGQVLDDNDICAFSVKYRFCMHFLNCSDCSYKATKMFNCFSANTYVTN